MSPLMQSAVFLCDTLFSFYMIMVLLRILLQWVRADFYNPFCQTVLKMTNFFVIPLRRVIPAYYGIDCASVLLLLLLAFFKQGILILIETGIWAHPMGLLLLGIADIFELIFYIYIFCVIVLVVVSWLNPVRSNPLIHIATQLVTPLLIRIQRVLPTMSGFDLSPMVLTIILILFNMLVVEGITHYALMLV
jgi:YggT family protein